MTNLARFVGIPYKTGARGPDAVDCAGLVMMFYEEALGIVLPPMLYGAEITRDEIAALTDETLQSASWQHVEAAEFGDLLVFRMLGRPTHVGVYVGNGDFLHSIKGKDSCIERLSEWQSRLAGVLRWKR